jgi:hypothetical protein
VPRCRHRRRRVALDLKLTDDHPTDEGFNLAAFNDVRSIIAQVIEGALDDVFGFVRAAKRDVIDAEREKFDSHHLTSAKRKGRRLVSRRWLVCRSPAGKESAHRLSTVIALLTTCRLRERRAAKTKPPAHDGEVRRQSGARHLKSPRVGSDTNARAERLMAAPKDKTPTTLNLIEPRRRSDSKFTAKILSPPW